MQHEQICPLFTLKKLYLAKAKWVSVLDDFVIIFKLRLYEFLAAYDGILWAPGMLTGCL